MIEGQHDRFKDAPWYRKHGNDIIIGGAGGIGSWLALFLARAGFKIVVYDHDRYEVHNMGGQFVDHAHISTLKVDALSDLINEFSDESITTFDQMYDETGMRSRYIMSGFDNMEARKIMFNNWKSHCHNNVRGAVAGQYPILIDGRLLMEQMQIFCVRWSKSEDVETYEKVHLFDDSEVADETCTLKQTTHSAAMIAAMMTGFFTNHVTNMVLNKEVRAVPFMTEYFIPLNLMT